MSKAKMTGSARGLTIVLLVCSVVQGAVLPSIVDQLPDSILELKFGEYTVQPGIELSPTQVKDEPNVTWAGEVGAFYTLAMTNPDIPKLDDHSFGELIHWLVVNIPGSNVKQGETIAEFMSSGPPKGTGSHRYVFLVVKQPGKLLFDEVHINSTTVPGRFKFSIKQFVDKHGMEWPAIVANYYSAQWDEYVDELAILRNYKKLGGKDL